MLDFLLTKLDFEIKFQNINQDHVPLPCEFTYFYVNLVS